MERSNKIYVYREGQLLSEITNANARFEHNGKAFKLPYNLNLKPVYTENVSTITFYDSFEGNIISKSTQYWNSTIDAINVTESQINYYNDNQIFSGWFADENLNGVYDDGEMVYTIGESIVFTDKDINLYPYYSNYLYVTYIDENNISNGIKVIDNNNLYYLPDVSDSGFWYLDSNNNSEYDSGEVEITDVNYEDSNKYYNFNYDKINAIFIYDSNNNYINIGYFDFSNEFSYSGFTYRISGLDGENFYVIDVYTYGEFVESIVAYGGVFGHNSYNFHLPSYIRCARL